VDHQEAGPQEAGVRFWSAFLVLLLVGGAVGGGGWYLEHEAGLHTVRALEGGPLGTGAPSGAWYCPHGGGPAGWSANLSITNPGDREVAVRVRDMTKKGSADPRDLTVPPRTRISVNVPADHREASTEVEYFGGWVAAGWVAVATGERTGPAPSPSPAVGGESGTPGQAVERGVAAEPCVPAAGRTWILPDGTTSQGEEAFVIVMNPFATEAVFDLSWVAEGRVVDAGDLTLRGNTSVAVRVNKPGGGRPGVVGERTVAALVTASIGRVAAASLGITDEGGIRSTEGATETARLLVFPGAAGAGRTEVPMVNPGDAGLSYGVDALKPAGRQSIRPGDQDLAPEASVTETVTIGGPAALEVTSDGGESGRGGMAAARRSLGLRGDQGATLGQAPGTAWLLTSPASDGRDVVNIVLANPGRAPVRVTLSAITPEGPIGDSQDVTVPPGVSLSAPVDFLAGHGQASVVAVSAGGAFVAAETSTAVAGSGYSVAAGVPIPPRWVPAAP